MDLKTIANNVLNCKACAFRNLLDITSTPTPGFGNPMAKIMIVNFRTTLDAHEIDKPVGIRNEVLLKMILKDSGLSPRDVYFTNVLKCAGNIKPAKQFKANCNTCKTTHLAEEINTLNPEVIVCLGKSAFEHVLSIRSANVLQTYSLEEIYRHGRSYTDSATRTLSSARMAIAGNSITK